ncbi:MAG: hypothetical protein KDJ74_04965 [Notoacmeibacter sp.]|nr:hypothetical protein [Notoacmeibacter sp.]
MRLHVTTALIAGLAVLVSCSDNSKQEAAQTTEQKPVPKTVSDNGATMEIAPEFKAGSEAKIPFTAPEGSNNYWIGFVNPGAAPTDYFSSGYAYTSAGNPASVTVPGQPGDYELRFADDTAKTMLIGTPVKVIDGDTATVTVPETAEGSREISVSFTGPDGKHNLIAVVKAGTADQTYQSLQSATTYQSPLVLRMPASSGDYEVRYLRSIGKVSVAGRAPIKVTAAAPVTMTAAEAQAGQEFKVVLVDDAPRLSGDYIYIAKPGAPDNDYAGGYVAVGRNVDTVIKAPAEAGDWELRYIVPDNGDWVALGRAALTVK